MKKLFRMVAISVCVPLIMGAATMSNAFAEEKISVKESALYNKMCKANYKKTLKKNPKAPQPDCKGKTFIAESDGAATFRADILCQKGRLTSLSLFSPDGTSLTTWIEPLSSDMCAQDTAVAIEGFKADAPKLKKYLKESGQRHKNPPYFMYYLKGNQPK
jgi:hypothetical protein